jgi:phytol kinase
MNNVWGILLSILPIFVVIGIATVLQKKQLISDEGSRKFVHIGVSNWWILAMLIFTDPLWASIARVTFIVLNYISYRKNIFSAMERSGKGNLGTVYFPIALLILVLLTFTDVLGIPNPEYVGAAGMLVLGYGDGFAAVIGKAYGKHRWKSGKSLEGSLTMFFASFVVMMIIAFMHPLSASFLMVMGGALLVAVTATLLEAYTPYGLDNLSVPLITSLVYYVLHLLVN